MDTRTWTLPQFFLFGCVLSYHIPSGQGSVLPDLLYCPAGTYLSQGHFGGRGSCQPCFDGYYNSKNRHRDTECSACILYNEYDPTQALVSRCNATHNTVIKCIDGFFLDIEGGWLSCESCKDCGLWGQFEAQPCSSHENSKCCPQESMIIVDGACAFPPSTPSPCKEGGSGPCSSDTPGEPLEPLAAAAAAGDTNATEMTAAKKVALPLENTVHGHALFLILLVFVVVVVMTVTILGLTYLTKICSCGRRRF